MAIALTLHVLAATVWVGGMFFAHMALRPAVNQLLQPPQRLPLMLKVLDSFFPWVWVSVLSILGSGYWILFAIHRAEAPLSQWLMALFGSLMAVIFLIIYLRPYRRLASALRDGELARAGENMARVRRLIGINLLLGLLVTVLAVMGKYSGF